MRKVKRYSKIIIACISLICVLTVSALSTFARSDEPYYDDTFQMLNHKNVRSSVMLGKNLLYQSGWFKTTDFTFNQDESFLMVAYWSDAFTRTELSNNPASSASMYAQIGVMQSGLSGLTVEAGGILDIKFDWYYNIRLEEGIDNSKNGWSFGTDDLPVTALTKETTMYFSSSARTSSDGSHPWFAIDAVEIKNHGIYNNVDSDRSSALYWSTVHFRFYNDTAQTLEFEMFCPYYDVVSGWKEPQYKDVIRDVAGGKYPTVSDVGSVRPSDSRSYVYMGYKSNVLPSYKIVSAAGAGNFETEQSIQNATDSIVDELDSLGSTLQGSISDLSHDIEENFSDLDESINQGLNDLGNDIKDSIGSPSGSIYADQSGAISDLSDKHSELQEDEDALVSDISGSMEEVQGAILNTDNIGHAIATLHGGFVFVSNNFAHLFGELPFTFQQVVVYAICGGVLLSLVGCVPGIVNGISARVRSGQSSDKNKKE